MSSDVPEIVSGPQDEKSMRDSENFEIGFRFPIADRTGEQLPG